MIKSVTPMNDTNNMIMSNFANLSFKMKNESIAVSNGVKFDISDTKIRGKYLMLL